MRGRIKPILAVMVRYRTPLEESRTLRGLRAALRSDAELAGSYAAMIWDNSPEPAGDSERPASFLYRHAAANLGPSGAFNEARRYARARGHEWMLLLDQDTGVDAEFLRTMLRHLGQVAGRREVAAIVPTVCAGRTVVSPRQQLLHRNRAYPAGECGVAEGEAIAINSGSLVRVSALEKIGGFSTDFWLDYSDFYVFHRFYLHGLKLWRAADATLQHEMTVMDYEGSMQPWRYRNFSAAESAFNDLYKGRLENALQTLRVLVRALKQRWKYKNPEFGRIAWEQWKLRLATSREQRLLRWKAESVIRQTALGVGMGAGPGVGPGVSMKRSAVDAESTGQPALKLHSAGRR
jgi:GT2 family glycosyltransferase